MCQRSQGDITETVSGKGIMLSQATLHFLYVDGGSMNTALWNAEDYRRSADVHETAENIIRRVVSSILAIEHTRQNLDDEDNGPIDCAHLVDDGLAVALGEDIGCLDPDDLTVDNCEVLYVEKELRELLQRAGAWKS